MFLKNLCSKLGKRLAIFSLALMSMPASTAEGLYHNSTAGGITWAASPVKHAANYTEYRSYHPEKTGRKITWEGGLLTLGMLFLIPAALMSNFDHGPPRYHEEIFIEDRFYEERFYYPPVDIQFEHEYFDDHRYEVGPPAPGHSIEYYDDHLYESGPVIWGESNHPGYNTAPEIWFE